MALRLDYFFKETFQGLRRNGLVAFAAVSTSFIALFLWGGSLLMGREVPEPELPAANSLGAKA